MTDYSPNLLIAHLQPNPSQPDIPVNTAFDTLDLAQTGVLNTTITTADIDWTLTDATQLAFRRAHYHRLTGVLTAPHNYIVPPYPKPFVVAHLGSGFAVTVKTATGSGVPLTPGATQPLYCDGVQVLPEGPATTALGAPLMLSGFVSGRPDPNGYVLIVPIVFPLVLPAGLAGSRVQCETAATATKTFDLRRAGVTIGQWTIPAGGQVATFSMASAVTLAVNDQVTGIAPSVQDATLANMGMSFVAYRA